MFRSIRARWLGITLIGASVFTTSHAALAQEPRPNYVAPLVGILTFDTLVNRYGHHSIDPSDYDVSIRSIRRNLSGRWVVDNDPFATNQFLHPYQGSMYHSFARSAGLNYWQSLGYAMLGSALWEIAGETTPPSINDQIATGIGGTFLGESSFRVASLLLERGDQLPRFWRNLLAAGISPATQFNRFAYGDRFRGVFSSRDAVVSARVDAGFMGTASVQKGLLQSISRNQGAGGYSVDYGQPWSTSYGYARPFDYFNFELGASSANTVEHVFTRGLLAGRSYGGDSSNARGIWGLYGTYDYVSPQIFRVGSVAASLGDTSTRRLGGTAEMQMTTLAGVGYGAAGTMHSSTDDTDQPQDYHYGITPQLLVDTKFISSEHAALDVTLRDFYVSRLASSNRRGAENNIRVDSVFTVRMFSHHGASVKYIWSRRTAAYPDLGNVTQSRGTFGLFYTYLADTHLGAVSR